MMETVLKVLFIVVMIPWTWWVLRQSPLTRSDEDAWEWYCREIW